MLDYAYTLQGWLKGLNASTLALTSTTVADFDTRDMGRDGKSGNTDDFTRTKTVARDVAAFTLGYYYGDYRRVNTTADHSFELTVTTGAHFNTASPSLYNGNIRHAVYSIARLNDVGSSIGASPEGYAHKYDQLNRLVSMRAHINYNLGSTFAWSNTVATSNNFQEDAAYDPNGNILRYLRRGNNSADYVMDSLTYHYLPNTNKLTYIDDSQTNTAAYAGDLEDQPSDNYGYDAIGNLIQDKRDSITNITWTNTQKIDSIIKQDRTITFRYNPMQQRVAKYGKWGDANGEKRTYYVRDPQGNVMATYTAWVKNNSGTITWDSMRLSEQHLYGSTRVGMVLSDVKLYPLVPKNPHLPDSSHYFIYEGWKRYEISNHLGNVLAVITDRKRGKAASGTAIQWFEADVVSAQQYYPFGMLMPGHGSSASLRRQYTLNGNDYRYGFNGKEGDDEVKGDDNQQDYGMRIYDTRVGRFLSVDPIATQYPMLTPYQFASNRPIDGSDLDGKEWDYKVDEQGRTSVKVNVQVTNETESHIKMTNDQIEHYLAVARKQFSETLSKSSGEMYTGEMTTTFNKVDNSTQVIPTIGIATFQNKTGIAGVTGEGGSIISLLNPDGTFKTPEESAIDFVHELFHTLRMEHPFETTQTEDTELLVKRGIVGKIPDNFISTTKTDPNIYYNILMYGVNTVNGKKLSTLWTETKQRNEYLTKGQLSFMANEINLQKAGRGSNKLTADYGEYWYNPPGKPVEEKKD